MKSIHKYINHFHSAIIKTVFLFFILISVFNLTQAQTIIISDNTTLQPINKATIKSTDGDLILLTNEKGEVNGSSFSMLNEVSISSIGYQELVISWNEIVALKFKIGLSPTSYSIDEIVVSSSRFEEKKSDVPNRITIISSKQIENINPNNNGTVLEQSGQVFVQHSQYGGSSPVMRGFEANKVLIVVDGVRMNNAIFRGGHLQNIITLDPSSLDRMELVFGPGSVIYGSDAFGGVMHVYTKNPQLSSSDKSVFKAGAWGRFSSADEGMAGHVDFNFGTKKFASLTSFSYSDFGDLRQGNIRNPMYGDWGKRNFYVMWTGTGDSMVKNNDPNVQVGTGYKQYDVMEKLLFKQNDHVSHLLNFQFSTTTDVPRYDRLSEIGGNGNLSNGDWYYGPQKRVLGSYNLGLKADKGFYNNANIILAYQDVEESRHSRKFNSGKLTNRNEHVTVLSLNADFEKRFSSHEFRYGLEAVMNKVESTADFVELISGETGAADTRFPDGGSSTRSLAAYLTHSWEIGKKIVFSQGLRFTNNNLQSTFNDTTFFKFPFKDITQSSNAVTGNIGLVFKPCEGWNISLLFSNGFRTPNVDDMTKVFETAGGDAVIVPNADLKPEQLYNTELTISKTFNKAVRLEATGWYAMYKNAITTDYATFNGADSLLYEGVMTKVKSAVNKGEAFVYGATGSLYADVTKNFIVYSTVTYTYGRIKTDTVDYPLDHIPPMFGKTGIQLNLKRFSGEAFVMYNGAKAKKDYNLLGEDNQVYSLDPVNGYNPAWMTVNARVGYQVNKILQLQVSVENILDQNYRYFASGLSAPGRNLIATLRARF